MKTIVGLFDDRTQAQAAATQLEAAGIGHNDISFLANNQDKTYGNVPDHTDNGDNMAHYAVKDAEWGAGIGGVLGLLAGASLFVIPGLGWVAGAGWLAGLLGGAALGGVVGGLWGALTHIGVPEEDAAYYTEGVRRGGTLLAVRAEDDQATRVAQILDDAGAVDIDTRGAQYRQEGFLPTQYSQTTGTANTGAYTAPATANTASYTAPAMASTSAMAANTATDETRTLNANESVTVPILEEEMVVGKREVQRGGARVHTYVEQRPVSEQVNLREEHVTVDRQAVNRPVTTADWAAFRSGTIEVTETAEEAVVGKTAHVVEEVTIGKEASQRTETVTDTIRRTGVDVEELDSTETVGSHVSRAAASVEGNIPGIQTGGVNRDGSTDTRGITEKIADTVTGDNIDDKTGAAVR